MGIDAVMAIAVQEARSACAGEPDITERVKKAMRACRDHWMVTNEGQQLNSALAAAMLESNDEEKDRIGRSGKVFNLANQAMQALIAGVPVDLEKMVEDQAQYKDLLPIADLWRNTARA